jgi:hypothetical protein
MGLCVERWFLKAFILVALTLVSQQSQALNIAVTYDSSITSLVHILAHSEQPF